MRRPLLGTITALTLLLMSGGVVSAQETSPVPGASSMPEASPTPDQLAEAEERLATASCQGKPATIVAMAGFDTVGTSEADVIVGTAGDDVIKGKGGNDRICAGAGADVVEGGADNDRLHGNTGDDILDGGKGEDICVGGPGHDWLPGCHASRATSGRLVIRQDTTLRGPHRGSIVIEADGITLDCGGHTVSGKGAGVGIWFGFNRQRITVKDCAVTNFETGVLFDQNRHNKLTRSRAYNNAESGVNLRSAHENTLTWNVADGNGTAGIGTGFAIGAGSSDNVLRNNSASGNGDVNFGIWEARATGNTLSQNSSVGSMMGFAVNGPRNTLVGNTAAGARRLGFKADNTQHSSFLENVAIENGTGFFIGGLSNVFTGNAANDNRSVGFEQEPSPEENTFADNTCTGNGRDSVPPGLCATDPPPLADPSPKP